MKNYIIILIVLLFCQQALAQSAKDDFIFSAMQDEMQRSLDSLTYNDHHKPFFISYVLYESEYLHIDSDIGALSSSVCDSIRSWSLRLMIGDYSLNDENYEIRDNYSSFGFTLWSQPEFPINNDYLAMRKLWWLGSDDVYRSAINLYEKKRKTIEEQKLQDNELLLPDYTQEDSLTLILERKYYPLNKKVLENKMTQLSAACLKFPKILYSNTQLHVNKSTVYHLNSEQIKYKLPLDETNFSLSLTIEDTNLRSYSTQMEIRCRNPLYLPDNDIILKDAEILANYLLEQTYAPVMEEDYVGPVLFEGDIAAQILCSSMFTGNDNLIAERQTLKASSHSVHFSVLENGLQKKWKKKILPENICISVFPKLQNYQGIELLGASLIDYEGVIPPDTIDLVKNGILVGMLADRIPTTVTDRSNGHYRVYPNTSGVSTTHQPGVVKFSSNKVVPEAEMKSRFIEYAASNGYEYAYIIRTIQGERAQMPYVVYRVDTQTGVEQLVRNSWFKTSFKVRDFKDIIEYSDKISVYNGSQISSGYSEYDVLSISSDESFNEAVSYISPYSFFIEEFTINGMADINNLHKNVEYLPNPIKEYKKQLEE